MTTLGEHLLEITRRMFLFEEEAGELLGRARDLTTGHLRVGADGPYHVVPFLASFAERYPAVHISLSIGNSEEILDSLIRYRADVAVVADVAADPRLERILCAEHRLVAFVPRQHAWSRRRSVGIGDFEDQPMILRETGSKTRKLFELAVAKGKVRPRVVMEIESREAVREAVAAGLGIGIVSEAEFGHDDRLVAVPVTDAELGTREYVEARPQGKRRTGCGSSRPFSIRHTERLERLRPAVSRS